MRPPRAIRRRVNVLLRRVDHGKWLQENPSFRYNGAWRRADGHVAVEFVNTMPMPVPLEGETLVSISTPHGDLWP